MVPRLELQALLIQVLGSNQVYFQPPPSIQMSYPAIVYKRNRRLTKHASNKLYKDRVSYQVTVIDPNPDSSIPDKVLMLPNCSFDRFFAVGNLNHDVFTLFF